MDKIITWIKFQMEPIEESTMTATKADREL